MISFFFNKFGKFFLPGLNIEIKSTEHDWNRYHITYGRQLLELNKRYSQILNDGDYLFENNELARKRDIPPLHPNHRLLYETIIQLAPKSIIEIGCGWGDHLKKISILCPEAKLCGIDLSSKQLFFP